MTVKRVLLPANHGSHAGALPSFPDFSLGQRIQLFTCALCFQCALIVFSHLTPCPACIYSSGPRQAPVFCKLFPNDPFPDVFCAYFSIGEKSGHFAIYSESSVS